MPRDASGNYTLPEAPFQPNTLAASARVNHNFTDIAAALSDSFSVSLGQPLQGPLNMNGQPIENLGGNLSVAGTITSGGALTAPAATISGTVTAGAVSTSGTVAVGGNLSVAGTITSGGALTAPAATISGTVTAGAVSASGTVTAGAVSASGGVTVGGNLSVAGRIYEAGIGVVYQGVGGSNGIAFTWTGAGPGNSGVNVYVDTTWVGRMFLDTSGAPLTERLDALEARIAALEAAQA